MAVKKALIHRSVKRSGRGLVRVYSGKELAGLLNGVSAQAVQAQRAQRLAHQVELRCRTVVPTYRRDLEKR